MVDNSIVNGNKSTTRIIPLKETTYNELYKLNYLCEDGECDFDSIIIFLIEHCTYLERLIRTREELHDLCRVFEDNRRSWKNVQKNEENTTTNKRDSKPKKQHPTYD